MLSYLKNGKEREKQKKKDKLRKELEALKKKKDEAAATAEMKFTDEELAACLQKIHDEIIKQATGGKKGAKPKWRKVFNGIDPDGGTWSYVYRKGDAILNP